MDAKITILAEGLQFPEGPIARPDGSVIFVEIARGALSQWHPGTGVSVIADLGGGPNGAAIGPDGAVYVCNNGGFAWSNVEGLLIPGHQADDYETGRIDRVDLETGAHSVLYTGTDHGPLSGPNDIVFDREGGFWFTDLGKSRKRDKDWGAIYYAKPDGSMITCAVPNVDGPNGIGLSPDETTLYVALTMQRILLAFEIEQPGVVAPNTGFLPGTPVGAQAPDHLLDSLAVQADGRVCVGTLLNGGITTFDPASQTHEFAPMPDLMATNICFGGPDLETAFITCSTTGKLISCPWPQAGLNLNYSGL